MPSNYDRINQARLQQLDAKKKERRAKNPVSAFFSEMVGDGAAEHDEAMTRTFTPYALADGESMDELEKKTGFKSKPKYPSLNQLITRNK